MKMLFFFSYNFVLFNNNISKNGKKIIFVDKVIFMSYFNFLKKEKLFINNLKFSKSMNQ